MIQYLLPTSPQAFLPSPIRLLPGDLTTGIRALDEDHQLLLGILNQINEAVRAGHDLRALRPLLHHLVAHTQFHFAREEKFFRETRYPGAADHEREHLHLLRQLLDIQSQFDLTSAPSSNAVDFLNHWFASHIHESDSQFAPFLDAASRAFR